MSARIRWSGIVFLMVLIFMIGLTGCGKPKLTDLEKQTLSKEGVRAEDFLPEDTFVLAEFNLSDAEQKAEFDQLLTHFPKADEAASLEAKLIKSIDENLQAVNLSYEKDVKPLLLTDSRLTLAGRFPAGALVKETYLSQSIKDVAAYDQLLAQVVTSGKREGLSLIDHKGGKLLFDNDSNLFVTRVKDVAVAGFGLDQGKALLERYSSGKKTLAANKDYRAMMAKLPASRLGYFYLDVQSSLQAARQAEAALNTEGKNKPASVPDGVLGEVFALVAEPQGLRLTGFVAGNPKSELDFNDYVGSLELYKVMPFTSLLAYFEGFNLKKLVETSLGNATKADQASKEAYEQWKEKVKKITQLDFEKDILSWMNKNYAVLLSNNVNSALPGISAAIQSSDSKKAKELSRILDAQLAGLLPFLSNVSPALYEAFSHDEVTVGGAVLSRWMLDLGKLASAKDQPITVPEPLQKDSIVLQYGVTDDDNFIVSTYKDLGQNYGKGGLLSSSSYAEAVKEIASFKDTVLFVEPSEVLNYMEFLMNLAAQIKGQPADEADKANWELTKSYIKPIKSVILGSKLEKKSGEVAGFVKIGE